MNKPFCIIDLGHAANSKVFYHINHKDSDIMMPTPESNLKLTPKEISLIEKWSFLKLKVTVHKGLRKTNKCCRSEAITFG